MRDTYGFRVRPSKPRHPLCRCDVPCCDDCFCPNHAPFDKGIAI